MSVKRRVLGRGGQASVELALCLPVVLVLLLTVLQVGLVVRAQVLVTHAAREAARAAAVDVDPSAPAVAARRAGGLDADRLEVTVVGRDPPGGRVEVEVRYRLEGTVPIVGRFVSGRIVTATAAMRTE